jgi:hypothetical protein
MTSLHNRRLKNNQVVERAALAAPAGSIKKFYASVCTPPNTPYGYGV